MARIALHNCGTVAVSALERIAESAELPPGKIRLIVGDPLLDEQYQACTIARDLVRWAGSVWGLDDHLGQDWECGVVIGRKWAALQGDFPAYFAYLLAHEFGHATTVLTRLWLAVYEDMILRYMPKIFRDRRWRWDEFPHEIRYDRFGAAVAERVYGRHVLEQDFARVSEQGLTDDEARLKRVLDSEPSMDLAPLADELADFSEPYREQLGPVNTI